MNKSYQYLNIDINKKIYRRLNAVQGDTKSRYILVSLYNNSIAFDLSNCSVKVFGVKSDKKIFFNYANITDASKGQFEIELTSQALAVNGELQIQILVLGANQERLTTCTFFIDVDKTIVDDNAIQSENEFTALAKGLADLAEYDTYKNNVLKHDKNLIKHEDKLNEVGSQLEYKANKTEVIKKGYGTLNDFDETTRAMIQGIEPGNINAVLGLKNVQPQNTSFFKRGINLFDKSRTVDNSYLDISNGKVVQNDYSNGFFTTDYIYIENEITIKTTKDVRYLAFYDINKTFIEGSNTPVLSFSIPPNTRYIKLTFYDLSIKDSLMVVDSINYPCDYAEFIEYIPSEYVEKIPFSINEIPNKSIGDELLKDRSITPTKIVGCEPIGNLLPSAVKFVKGYYAYDYNSRLQEVANENYCYYIIEVEKDTVYSFTNARFVLGLSDLENTIFYEQYLTSVNTGSAKYLVISSDMRNYPIEQMCIVKGTELTTETLYKIDWLDTSQSEDSLKHVDINIPQNLYYLENNSLNIYFDNIINDSSKYNIDVTCNKGIHYEKRVGSFALTDDTDITFSVYDTKQNLLNSIDSKIKFIPFDSGNGITKKCLFIGDSTTDAGKYTKKLLDLFDNDVMNIELLGTRGEGLNKHEGRSGWSATGYCVNAQIGDKVNAFYNPNISAFDFTYYMNQQGYNKVDYVFIHLGINDIFIFNNLEEFKLEVDNILSKFDFMINSIKTFNSNIKVCIMLTIPPNASQTAFGSAYGCGQTRWRYKTNYHAWVNRLIQTYDNRQNENIFIVPINTVLDTEVDIDDAVHPKKDTVDIGYNKMALPIYYFIKYLGSL